MACFAVALGAPRPHHSCVSLCALQGAARNRMLIKGGSSFNALVRAMKQDLVEGGAGGRAGSPPRDPNLLYEVDRLSMNRVTVFPDEELNVQAMAGNSSAAFARAASAGMCGGKGGAQVDGSWMIS